MSMAEAYALDVKQQSIHLLEGKHYTVITFLHPLLIYVTTNCYF